MLFEHLKFDWRPQFEAMVATMMKTTYWKQMKGTTENSPWHREASVALHTTMVTDWAIHYANEHNLSSRDAKVVAVAAFFHDFGKPDAEQEKTNEETGHTYRVYYGHEKMSARIFESIFVDRFEELFQGWLSPDEAHVATFLIEFHLPYKIEDVNKKKMYGRALTTMLDSRQAFYAMLKGDCWGRISDDHDQKKADMLKWIDEWEQFCVDQIDKADGADMSDAPKVIFMVGPSGAGKSTIVKEYLDQGYKSYSWDTLRDLFYAFNVDPLEKPDRFMTPIDRYRAAYAYCEEHNESFSQYINDVFRMLLDEKSNIVVDNTNLTRKRRAHLLQMARQKGYATGAVFKQTSKRLLIKRALMRTDKKIPLEAIEAHFDVLDVPLPGGEFHQVIVNTSNL